MATPYQMKVEAKGHIHAEDVNPATAKKVDELLMKNHDFFHTYFLAGALHSTSFYYKAITQSSGQRITCSDHIVHHALAHYALGATPEQVQFGYDVNSKYQLPPILKGASVAETLYDEKEFKKHLGNHERFSDYVKFFAKKIETKGFENTVNEYLFKGDARADDMLARLFGGEPVHSCVTVSIKV